MKEMNFLLSLQPEQATTGDGAVKGSVMQDFCES
jgi:hypothetical protein